MSRRLRQRIARRTMQRTLNGRLRPIYHLGLYEVRTASGATAPAVCVAKYRLHQHGRELAFLSTLLWGTAS